MKVLQRLFIGTPESPINPMVHMWFFVTLSAGIAFLFFGHTDAVQSSILWQVTNANLSSHVLNLWGLVAIIVTAVNTWAVYARNLPVGITNILVGVMLWLYAVILYAIGGFWFHVFVIGLPNLAFWSYYYMYMQDFKRIMRDSP